MLGASINLTIVFPSALSVRIMLVPCVVGASPSPTLDQSAIALILFLGVTLMSRILSLTFIVLSAFVVAFAQEPNRDDPPSTGIAPKVMNGIGRADVRVRDENGNPIKLALV